VRVGNHVYMMCADPAGRALAPMSMYVSVCERESVYVCVREGVYIYMCAGLMLVH